MANPLFQAMGGNSGAPTVQQMVQQIKNNASQVLNRRYNIPQSVDMRNPNAILDYLVRTGQVSQQDYDRARQQAAQMGYKG